MTEIVRSYFQSIGKEVNDKQINDVCRYCKKKEIQETPISIFKFLGDRPYLVNALLLVGLPY